MHNNIDKRWTAGFLTAAVAGIAVLIAACGGSPATARGSAAGQQTTHQKVLAFVQCMRSHGEPKWPDPTSRGNFDESQIDISAPQHARTLATCTPLRPLGSKILESAEQQRDVQARLSLFATCLRSHGYAKFANLSPGKRTHASPTDAGIDPFSPLFRSTLKACGAVQYGNGWWIVGT